MSLMSSSTRIYEVVAGNQPNGSSTPVGASAKRSAYHYSAPTADLSALNRHQLNRKLINIRRGEGGWERRSGP